MYIVTYRATGALNCETEYHGPFATDALAYDFACTLPAPCDLKCVEPLAAPATVHKVVMAKPDGTPYVNTKRAEYTDAELDAMAQALGWPVDAEFPGFVTYIDGEETGSGGGRNSGQVGRCL